MSGSKEPTIQEREEDLEQILARLRPLNLPGFSNLPALETLAPKGFKPVVELYENDRKKRRTASAETWSPSTGEIRISFEPVETTDEVIEGPADNAAAGQILSALLSALQEAEGAPGRSFVALKWFRDEYLPSTGLSWAQDERQRQAVLTQAIKDAWIVTSRIANPRAPLYPTTTIRLNRQKTAPGAPPASRFRPAQIAGESLSSTILRDRGTR